MNPENLKNKIISDRKIRRAVTRLSHQWFFHIFFGRHIIYPTAPFHKEIFRLTEDQEHQRLVVMAFRGSGKSTILTLSYPLWSILGVQQKKHVVIISGSREQTKAHFLNLREELKHNQLLRNDLGPFEEERDELNSSYSLELPHQQARVTAVSAEGGIRGIRYGPHRPDLIICDDLEDTLSVRYQNHRDRIYQWLMSEVVPAGDKDTRLIIIGNLLHEDSLLMRLRKNIEEGRLKGIFRAYPLIDDGGKTLWPGKFPTPADISRLRGIVPDESIWEKEYLLMTSADSATNSVSDLLHIRTIGKDGKLDGGECKQCKFCRQQENVSTFMRSYKISAPIIKRGGFILEIVRWPEEAQNA